MISEAIWSSMRVSLKWIQNLIVSLITALTTLSTTRWRKSFKNSIPIGVKNKRMNTLPLITTLVQSWSPELIFSKFFWNNNQYPPDKYKYSFYIFIFGKYHHLEFSKYLSKAVVYWFFIHKNKHNQNIRVFIAVSIREIFLSLA